MWSLPFLNETNDASQMIFHFEGLKVTLEEILPHSFGPIHLGNDQPLLKRNTPSTAAQADTQDLVAVATRAAGLAYSPYTASPAGAAVRLKDGTVGSGYYMENCAYNPSMAPLQAAFVDIVSRGAGARLCDISHAVLAERKDAPVQHAEASSMLLRRVAPEVDLQVVHL